MWTVAVAADGRVYIETDDFTHDTRLYVTGDWATPEDHWAYASRLARKLNGTLSLDENV